MAKSGSPVLTLTPAQEEEAKRIAKDAMQAHQSFTAEEGMKLTLEIGQKVQEIGKLLRDRLPHRPETISAIERFREGYFWAQECIAITVASRGKETNEPPANEG